MRVTYITAGAAEMICGSCLRDNALARKLRDLECEVTLVPVYTPITVEEEDLSTDKLLLGGISVYLEQSSSLFRKIPSFLTRWLDKPGVVKFFTKRKSIQVEAEHLGHLTLSILKGENGNQSKSFGRAFNWIKDEAKPEIINFSNLLIASLAPTIKRELNIPIVVTLQGDDLFINELNNEHRNEVIRELKRIAESVDAFITFSEFYAQKMSTLLGIPIEKFHIVTLGINTKPFSDILRQKNEHQTIGYFGRIASEKGFHNAVDAFIQINKDRNHKIHMRAGGWLGKSDRPYFEKLMKKIEQANLAKFFNYYEAPTIEDKKDFFSKIDIFTMPTDQEEPKGIPVLESLASGVPVIQPDKGVFNSIINITNGGMLYDDSDPLALSEALISLLNNPDRTKELGKTGRLNVEVHFSDTKMANDTKLVYEKLLNETVKH